MKNTRQSRKRKNVDEWDTACSNFNISMDPFLYEPKSSTNNASDNKKSIVGKALSAVCYQLNNNEYVRDVWLNKSLDLLTEVEIQKLFEAIQKCKTVKYLNFSLYTSEKQNPQRMLKYLVPVIRSNNTIDTLVLRNVILEKEFLHELTEALSNSATLTRVDLSFTELKDHSIAIIQDMIRKATNLSILAISHLNPSIGVSEIKRLAENIKHTSRLQSLDLSMNKMGCEGAMILANTLGMSPNVLRILDISSNCIGEEGLAAVATLIAKNNQIEEINLARNFVNDETGTAIMRALEHNTHLTSLNLSHSGYVYFGEESYRDVGTMLSGNRTLRTLNLNGNDAFADPQRFRKVVHHLESNTSLRTIQMSMERRNRPALQQLLQRNISILEVDAERVRSQLVLDLTCIAKELKRNRYIQDTFGNPIMCSLELLPSFISKLGTTDIIFQCLRLALPRTRERI